MPNLAATVMCGWFEEVWNKGNAAYIDEHLPPHGVVHGLEGTGSRVTGPDGFHPFHDRISATFSNIHFDLNEVIESGSSVAIRWTMTVTHTGDGLGIPPTNKTVTVTGMTTARAEGDKVVEAWNDWDRAMLFTELGALVPASSRAILGK